MQTQLLDILRWDLCLNADGNIAVASDPYSSAQDVASACRTFLGEVYYDTSIGVAYLGGTFGAYTPSQFLGKTPSIAFVKSQLEAAAATVPGVTNPIAFVTGLAGRQLSGQIQFTDANGQTQTAAF